MCGRVPVATISEGPVQGYVESGPGNHVYLGVPFSASTAGQNRWKAPAPVAKRSSVFNATEYGHSCPQGSLSAILAPQGEDCLNLNIWAPSSGKGHNAMVTGGNSLATYNGTFFPADDVVLVTLNYRSNMFGAPHSPELSGTSANFGILDVFAGIGWVQKNIAAFRGDPAQITIFGQSSGGVMVDYYLWTHPNTTIKAAIIESATVFSGPNYAPEGVGLDAVSAEVGCPNGTAHGQLDCLRGKSLSELLTANFNATYATWFTPTIEEITRFRDYPARFRAGKFAKHVPAMLGNVDAEGTLFGEIVHPAVEEDPFSFWINTYDADAAHIVDSELLLHYSRSNYSSARIMAGDLYANLRFYCAIDYLNDLRSVGYLAELTYVFGGTFANASLVTPIAVEVAKKAHSIWVNFAKNPSAGPGWPRSSPKNGTLALLFPNSTDIVLASAGTYNGICQNFQNFWQPFYPVQIDPRAASAY